jgi:flagellar basal body-associated protein FliL
MNARENKSAAMSMLVIGVLFVVLFGGYVAGYFWLGKPSIGTSKQRYGDNPQISVWYFREREYPYRWLAKVYLPASMVEMAACGETVRLSHK